MEVNLKEHARDIEILKHVEKLLSERSETKGVSRQVRRIYLFMQEVETDLELGGECIVELDKPRLEAIEERNKMFRFKKSEDE
jgi:hypothetical protein